MEKMIITKENINEANLLEEILSDAVHGNRRSFLKRGSVAAAAVAMSGMTLMRPQSARAADDPRTDVQLLQESYITEQRAVNTYNTVQSQIDPVGHPLISGEVLSVAKQFSLDHKAHSLRFAEVITQLGGEIPADVSDTTLTVDGLKPVTVQLNTTAGILRYALAVEVYAMKLWINYSAYSDDRKAKRVFLDLAPNEAAHAAILRAALKLLLTAPTDHDNADPGKAIVPFSRASLDAPVF